MSIKQFFVSLFFYPLFIVPYLVYKSVYKIFHVLHYVFKIVYIENICGFKRIEKIIDSINCLSKRPEQVTLVFDMKENNLYGQQNLDPFHLSQTEICQEYIQIVNQVQQIKKINIHFEGESEQIIQLIEQLQTKLQSKQSTSLNKITIIKQDKKFASRTQKLFNENKNYTPLVIVFANYQQTCNLAPKYLINAEIAFNSATNFSTKYDLYRSFVQYANSKQRNGK